MYFGARYYDPRTSVWQSPDPALEKYLPTGNPKKDKKLPGMGGVFKLANLNLFGYTHQNPIKYIDPDGKKIFLKGSTRQKRLLLSYINKHTNGNFVMARNGRLKLKRGTRGDSTHFGQRLLKADRQGKDITIDIGQKFRAVKISRRTGQPVEVGREYSVDRMGGGGITMGYKGTKQVSRISNNPNARTLYKARRGEQGARHSVYGDYVVGSMSPSSILRHELLSHSIPNSLGESNTGSSYKLENADRARKGERQRLEHPHRQSGPKQYTD